MDFDDDPFPSSFPHCEDPQILGTGIMDTVGNSAFELDSTIFDSPSFSASYPRPHEVKSSDAVVNPTALTLASSQSFDSFPDSSSSDTSGIQHRRDASSDSSRSGALSGNRGPRVAAGIPAVDGTYTGASSLVDAGVGNELATYFDFESAASSPNLRSYTTCLNNSPPVKTSVPHRAKPGSSIVPGKDCKSRILNSFQKQCSNSSSARTQYSWPPTPPHSQQATTEHSADAANGNMLRELTQGRNWQRTAGDSDTMSFEPCAADSYDISADVTPFVPAQPFSGPVFRRPTLHVYPLPPKSRVETQIQVKLTLYPMPPGVSRLHLQSHTMTKPKLMAKPSPEKSPDMLELYAMLVCTTAMQDSEKRNRALAFAASPRSMLSDESRPSSSVDPTTSKDNSRKPLDGGEVHVCAGCITRESKRTGRKKTRNIEEEHLWQSDAWKRGILFNTPEIKVWQQPSAPKAPRDGNDTQSNSEHCEEIFFPRGTKQIDLPMRITCYCRHHEEKMGYHVIFTIRDYQDNVLTQQMTSSIFITDDHKNSSIPNATPQDTTFPSGVELSRTGALWQTPTSAPGPATFRSSYSTTDLEGMQQRLKAQQIGPYTLFRDLSQTTSASMTPKPHSRPASPTMLPGQQRKKRKAGSSGRICDGLTMTKLQTATSPTIAGPGIASPRQSLNTANHSDPAFAPSYGAHRGQPAHSTHSQYSTQPTTPSTTDGAIWSATQQSQGMENSASFSCNTSAPGSAWQSRVPSPISGPQNHAHVLTNSLYSVPGAIHPHISPIIHKLTPAEGPKSGGIEVTCLGSGFHQGLEVMFGNAQATTTTFWGESALVCLVPPALRAGTVLVTFRHEYEHSATSPLNRLAIFNYFDDDEQQLMKHALALLNGKWNGNSTTAGDTARNIINFIETNVAHSGGSAQMSNQQIYPSGASAAVTDVVNLELAILRCLDVVDQDDSPSRANFNAQGDNGQGMLHLSASLGYYRLTAALLARGANPDIRDKNGMSPMHLASLRDHWRTISKLRSAGADSTLRSLNGYTAADMASSPQAHDASNALETHTRPRGARANSDVHLSRASSILSSDSYGASCARSPLNVGRSNIVEDRGFGKDAYVKAYLNSPLKSAQIETRSRHNSLGAETGYNDELKVEMDSNASDLAANPAMYAWRDQLLAQIQQLQQSLHRTLPSLQIPTLPPMPNLPHYQAYPVVKKISSLVPSRAIKPSTAQNNSDYHWWELLVSSISSPPAYEDLYPQNAQDTRDANDGKAFVISATGEAVMDQKCEASSAATKPSPVMETVNLGSSSLTKEQREQLRASHAMKVKRLRNDRNLILIWIPLLVLVLAAMLKDRIPHMLQWAQQGLDYVQNHLVANV